MNACIRGVARASYSMFDTEIVGIQDGYAGLISGDYKEMKQSDFSGILTLGGTILGTRRTPFRDMRVIGEDNVDKVKAMKSNYKKMKLDCLVTLGGNGTHKTANMLAEEGLNVIGLPKTIDNDIWGTVSYTHLDVYKRQDECRTYFAAGYAGGYLQRAAVRVCRGFHRRQRYHGGHDGARQAGAFPRMRFPVRGYGLWRCLLYTSRCV